MPKETKLQILKCFSNLLEKNELDKITVTMLVEECNISRQTFYYHFSDIQSLIDWGVKYYTENCVQEAKNAKNMMEATMIYLKRVDANRDFLRSCVSSSLVGYITTLIRKSIIEYSTEFYNQSVTISPERAKEAEFIIEFTANGVTGYILSMLYSRKDDNIEEIAEMMNKCVFKKLSQGDID
ncbi:MAG: TetR/AcrR family transcriptional regulator C-terminal domain-containing protein [Eubacterium sp.]|uniref:TetR/AcrR family transcriptional regulator C-terminal domain-containing protein n=1 Tax=Eubacterium sp. TaxID=142586 RepID=UPI003A273963